MVDPLYCVWNFEMKQCKLIHDLLFLLNIKNLWDSLKRRVWWNEMNLIFLSYGLKLFFTRETNSSFTYCFPTKGKAAWFKQSNHFRSELTQQNSVFKVVIWIPMKQWALVFQHMHRTLLTPHECGCYWPTGTLSCCFLLLCTRHARDLNSNRSEFHPADGKVSFPIWWLHIHPSKRALRLSESSHTHSIFKNFCGWHTVTSQN